MPCIDGVETVDFSFPWWVDSAPYFDSYRAFIDGIQQRTARLAEEFRARAVDVVFTNSAVVCDGAIAAAMAGIPHIWHLRELFLDCSELHPPLSLPDFYSVIHSLSHRVTANSRAVAEEIESFAPDCNVEVIYNGFDSEVFHFDPQCFSVPEGAKVVCFAGAFSERKGLGDLLLAARLLVPKLPNLYFAMIGADIDEARFVQSQLARHGLTHRFLFCGYREDPRPYFASADIVVVPSQVEAFSRVAVEAMLQEKLVIASRSGGPEEILEDGVTGVLVPPGDIVALAGAIELWIAVPNQVSEVGKRAAAIAREKFSLAQYQVAAEKIILEVAAQHRQPVSDFLGNALVNTLRAATVPALVRSREHSRQREEHSRQMREEVGRLRAEVATLRQENAQALWEIGKLNRDLVAVFQSRSWQIGNGIVAPTVAIGKRLQRLLTQPLNSP